MKKHLTLLLLPAIAFLLQGCKTRHCPAYPQEDTAYLPVDFIGQTLRYIYICPKPTVYCIGTYMATIRSRFYHKH